MESGELQKSCDLDTCVVSSLNSQSKRMCNELKQCYERKKDLAV